MAETSMRKFLNLAKILENSTSGPWAVYSNKIVTDYEGKAVDYQMPNGGYTFGHHIADVDEFDRSDNEPGASSAEDDALAICAMQDFTHRALMILMTLKKMAEDYEQNGEDKIELTLIHTCIDAMMLSDGTIDGAKNMFDLIMTQHV